MVKELFPYRFYPDAVINFNYAFFFTTQHNSLQRYPVTILFVFIYMEKIKENHCLTPKKTKLP